MDVPLLSHNHHSEHIMFVTLYDNKDVGDQAAFIRLNTSHNGAWDSALEDAKTALSEYDNEDDSYETRVIDCIEGEDDSPSIIRIIHTTTGYEYEAYIIEEHIVND